MDVKHDMDYASGDNAREMIIIVVPQLNVIISSTEMLQYNVRRQNKSSKPFIGNMTDACFASIMRPSIHYCSGKPELGSLKHNVKLPVKKQ